MLVRLTPEGEVVGIRLAKARKQTIERALEGLSADQQSLLLVIVDDLLLTITGSRPLADYICRFCDETACDRDCPVERRAREAEASDANSSSG